MKVGEKLGKSVKWIKQQTLQLGGKFARMCIEIDVLKSLQERFKYRRRMREVVYEEMHLVCFNCGIYGHVRQLTLSEAG